ncbi:MAG: hypothetical protein D4Q79_00690 [Spirochaetia bacterium]|nr:MAG: hypothetical protein D4Q79_00690 [Spirochaetia bacterium]
MKSFIKKSIIFLVVFTLVFGASILEFPKKAEAVWGIEDLVFDAQAFVQFLASWAEQIAKWAKEEAAKALRDIIVKRLMDYMTDQTIAWIQGGGKPQFVTDFPGFLRDSASAAIGDVVLQTGAAFICSPFKAQILLQLQPTPKFSENVKCTLDSIVGNINNFYNDFSKGGWIGYAEVMQPQNNYYGTALIVSANLNAQAAKAVDAASKEVQAGSGFLSVKRCKGGGIANPTPKDIDEMFLMKDFKGNYCQEKDLENTTPGNVVAESVKVAINSDSQWAANVQSVVSALVNALINRLVKEGLSTMSDSNSSSVNSAAGYTAPYNNLVSQNLGSGQNAMVSSITTFLDQWQYLLTQYSVALSSNSQVISALEQIRGMSCTINDEPGTDNILKALNVTSVDEALAKSNTAQTNLTTKVDNLETLVLEASSTIDQINILYLEITSTSTLSTTSTSTSTLGNPVLIAQVQGLYTGFMNKYNNQRYLLSIFSDRADADGEVADKANKARLANEALSACGSVPP